MGELLQQLSGKAKIGIVLAVAIFAVVFYRISSTTEDNAGAQPVANPPASASSTNVDGAPTPVEPSGSPSSSTTASAQSNGTDMSALLPVSESQLQMNVNNAKKAIAIVSTWEMSRDRRNELLRPYVEEFVRVEIPKKRPMPKDLHQHEHKPGETPEPIAEPLPVEPRVEKVPSEGVQIRGFQMIGKRMTHLVAVSGGVVFHVVSGPGTQGDSWKILSITAENCPATEDCPPAYEPDFR